MSSYLPGIVHALGVTHPSFTFKNILPAEMKDVLGLGGIDFLPNGEGVVCTWGGSQKSVGELWLIANLATGSPGQAVRIAEGLREPLGVKVIGEDIYLMEKPGIFRYSRLDTVWTRSKFFSLPTAWYDDSQWHHFSFGLEWRDSAFWFTTGSAYEYDADDPIERGALIRVPFDGSGFTQHARGLFNPDGFFIGPDRQFFTTDNQGPFKPANALLHLPTKNIPKDGRFFGYRTRRNNVCGTTSQSVGKEVCPDDPEYQPAIWIPYGSFSNSLTRPILLENGPYAGQMLAGDVYRGGLFRFSLERVNGEYQGAVFPFLNGGSTGIPYGIHQFIRTTSGDWIGIGVGNGCGQGGSIGWSFNQTCRGMHVFSSTDKTPFEMKAIRSTPTGFQIEFTQPAGQEAALASNYQVKTTVFTPQLYLGADASSLDNNIPVEVLDARLSEDGRFAELKLASLETRRMYAFTLSGILSAQGDSLFSGVGYYTLNQVPESVPSWTRAPRHSEGMSFGSMLRWDGNSRRITISAQIPFRIALKSTDGRTVRKLAGQSPITESLESLKSGVYVLTGMVGGQRHTQRIVLSQR